jgi:rSAM/selenodomain-associated transferase 2
LISIIIPALNEAQNLPETIARARGADEIIVVDGGSSDATPDVARELGATLISAKPGRAAQMNAGAAVARGSVFLFLHADTWLQPGALASIEKAMQAPAVVGGAFVRKFRSQSIFLSLTCGLARLRNNAIGWHLGDQAIFCRKQTFEALGGFAEMRAFEDLDFSRRLSRSGRIVTLTPAVLTSARRFDNGPVRRTLSDLGMTLRYLLHPASFRV